MATSPATRMTVPAARQHGGRATDRWPHISPAGVRSLYKSLLIADIAGRRDLSYRSAMLWMWLVSVFPEVGGLLYVRNSPNALRVRHMLARSYVAVRAGTPLRRI